MASQKLLNARKFIQAIPHAEALGMTLTELAEGRAEICMPYADHLVGDPETGVIHGGAVFAVMDTCCGAAVMSHPKAGIGTATIDLRVDYMRAATPKQGIRAVADCYHITRSVAFVRAQTFDDDSENPVAMATGTFTIEGR